MPTENRDYAIADSAEQMCTLVIIPTYNERANIQRLIPAVLNQGEGIDVLIVDDNSPDGTAEVVKAGWRRDARVHLLERAGKLGLGTAHIAGFRWAFGREYDRVITMDADFSHPPEKIPAMLQKSRNCEVVLGSRYVEGGGWENWPRSRVMLSSLSNWIARTVLRFPVKDCTGAYRCFHTRVLREIPLDNIGACGFAFQEEMLWQCMGRGWDIGEVPIVFRQREYGDSKIGVREIAGAMWTLLRLAFATDDLRRRTDQNM